MGFIGTQRGQQSSKGMEGSGRGLFLILAAPLSPQTHGRWPEQTDNILQLESHNLYNLCRDTGRPAVLTSSHQGTAQCLTSQ